MGYVQLPIFKNNGDLWSHINSSSSSAASADGNGSNTSGAVKKFVTQAHLQQLARDVLQALSLFENYGLVHGDVRPQTIFVSDDEERAQLEYYGPNVQQHHLQHHHHHYSAQPSTSGAIYMAPEVIKSQQYSLKSDIYSFGLVLYDMHFPSGDTNSLSLSASGVRDSLILSINGKGVSSSDTSSSKSGSGYSLKLSIPDHSCTELSDLMRRLLDLDPAKRPSASDALKHPYFKLKFGLSADNNNNSSSSSSIKSSLKKIEAISSGSTNSIRECVCCLKSFKTLDPSTPSLFECKSSSSSQHHPSHSICQPCLTDLVKSYCQTDPSIIVSNPSAIPLGIPCPGELMDDMVTRGRDPRTRASFSLETLFKALDSETYDEYLSWESEIKELRMFNSVLNAQEVIPVIGGRGAGFSHPEAGSDAETHATFIKNCVASRTCPRCLAPHHAFSIEHSVLSSASSLKMSSAPTSIISLMLDCKRCLGCFCGVCNTQVSGSKSCDSHLKVCTSRNDMKLINHNNSSPSSLALVSHFHDFQRKLSAQRVDKYISSLPESKRVEVMKLL